MYFLNGMAGPGRAGLGWAGLGWAGEDGIEQQASLCINQARSSGFGLEASGQCVCRLQREK